MMQAVQPNKSSIDFLLSDSNKDELVLIEPKTTPKTGNSRLRKITRPKSPELSLELLQQPLHAKVTPRPPSRIFPPFSEHRPIYPPPVLQLKVEDFKPPSHDIELTDEYLESLINKNDARSIERVEELHIVQQLRKNKIPSWAHYSTFFVIARLKIADGQNERALFNHQGEKSIDDLLIGTKVCSGMSLSLRSASPSNSFLNKPLPKEKVTSDCFGITFVFSDLSVKKVGKFKLKFDLFEVYQSKIYLRSEIYSNEFQVFTPKKFPGSSPSTPLTTFLYRHGARIRQKKRGLNKREHSEIDQDDSYEEQSSKASPTPGYQKKPLKITKYDNKKAVNDQTLLVPSERLSSSLYRSDHVTPSLPPFNTLSKGQYEHQQPFPYSRQEQSQNRSFYETQSAYPYQPSPAPYQWASSVYQHQNYTSAPATYAQQPYPVVQRPLVSFHGYDSRHVQERSHSPQIYVPPRANYRD